MAEKELKEIVNHNVEDLKWLCIRLFGQLMTFTEGHYRHYLCSVPIDLRKPKEHIHEIFKEIAFFVGKKFNFEAAAPWESLQISWRKRGYVNVNGSLDIRDPLRIESIDILYNPITNDYEISPFSKSMFEAGERYALCVGRSKLTAFVRTAGGVVIGTQAIVEYTREKSKTLEKSFKGSDEIYIENLKLLCSRLGGEFIEFPEEAVFICRVYLKEGREVSHIREIFEELAKIAQEKFDFNVNVGIGKKLILDIWKRNRDRTAQIRGILELYSLESIRAIDITYYKTSPYRYNIAPLLDDDDWDYYYKGIIPPRRLSIGEDLTVMHAKAHGVFLYFSAYLED